MKITVDPFDKKSITAAIKKLERYEKEFKAKEAAFVRRLMEIGVSVAETGFALADYDGINDVLIAETQNGARAAIIAYGTTVGFIEFGTGVKFREYDSSSTEFTPPAHGTYGKDVEHGRLCRTGGKVAPAQSGNAAADDFPDQACGVNNKPLFAGEFPAVGGVGEKAGVEKNHADTDFPHRALEAHGGKGVGRFMENLQKDDGKEVLDQP